MSSKEYWLLDDPRFRHVDPDRVVGPASTPQYNERAHVDLQFLLIGAALFAAVAYYRRK